jgi:hypothetical protein
VSWTRAEPTVPGTYAVRVDGGRRRLVDVYPDKRRAHARQLLLRTRVPRRALWVRVEQLAVFGPRMTLINLGATSGRSCAHPAVGRVSAPPRATTKPRTALRVSCA